MAGLSEQLADWVAGLRWEDIPQEVREAARLHILDVVGVMLAARPLDVVAAAERAVLATDAGSQARILGSPHTASIAGAAFVNGVMASLLEFDDTHIESFVHSTVAPFSAALPCCLALGLSGAQLMQAVIVGSELGCRLGLVSPVRLHSVGIHPTAVMGTFGAVYALAGLQGLSKRQIVGAIGHSASMSAGSMASWEDGTSTKTLHVGMAASQAVRAVALAREGISGAASAYDGRFGWFRTHLQSVAPADFRFARAAAALGGQWEMLNVASKPFPSAFTIHPYVDAVLAIRAAHRPDPALISAIHCRVAKSSIATLCEPVSEKLRPLTSWHGRISLQHSMAEALVNGKMDKSAYGPQDLANPLIHAMADKVVYEETPAGAIDATKSGAHVTITLKDGTRFTHAIDSVRGTRANPISTEDYLAKFRSNVDGVVRPPVTEQTIEALMQLEFQNNLAPLFDRLAAGLIHPA